MAARQALVREAMTHLRMRKGATLAQIRDQIASSYTGKVDVKKRGVLTSALKGLLEKGQVEKKGANFTLARTAKLDADEDDTVPGRRYRRRRHLGGGGRRSHRRRRHHRRRRSRRRPVRRRRVSRRRRRSHHKRRRHRK